MHTLPTSGLSTTDDPDDQKNHHISVEKLRRLEKQIYDHWITAPELPKDINTISGFDASERQIRSNPVLTTDIRRKEFSDFFKKEVAAILGQEIAESVYTQLQTNHSISTAEHSIPLSPNTLNAILFNSLPYFKSTSKNRQNLIVLGCAGVSISNNWYARGFLFQSLKDGEFIENQLNFFGRAMDSTPVISTPAINNETQKNMLKTIAHLRSHQFIKKREFNKLNEFINSIIFTSDLLNKVRYIDQLTLINFNLWKNIFKNYKENTPNLIFLSQEKIALKLIKEFHLEKDTIINNIIFNNYWHKLIYKYFNNIPCAFSTEKEYGTFLFWGISKESKSRIQLFMKDGILSSLDGTFKIEVTPDNIKKAIEQEEILPSVMLTFIILSLYYGYFLTGGLLQPGYLSKIKLAYLSLMKELGLEEEVKNSLPISGNDVTTARPAIAFLEGPRGQRVPASGLDMYLYGDATNWNDIIHSMKSVTLKELYLRMYPDIYKNRTKMDKRDDDLLKITEKDIEEFTKINKKIPPWARLETI